MNITIKNGNLFAILLFFYVLSAFAFPVGSFVIPFYFVVSILFIIYIFFKNPNLIFKKLKDFYNTRMGKYLVFFLIWIFITIFVSILTGTFILKSFFSNFIGNFFCTILFPILIPIVILPNFLSYKKLGKYLLILYFFVGLTGVIEYIANTYNISVIQDIFNFFINRNATISGNERVFVQAYGRFRISGIFQEPGNLAGFIFMSCPIIYFLCKTKIKLLRNRLLDSFVKLSTLIFSIICFIGTQSPINLSFMLIFLGIVFIYKLFKLKIKHKGVIFLTIGIFILLSLFLAIEIFKFMGVDITETFIVRIINVSKALTSITVLTIVEPSLATRIGNYAAQWNIGLHHPIFGVGYGNINSCWAAAVKSLPFPITDELAFYAFNTGKQAGGGAILFKLIAETGFVGTFLFIIFITSVVLNARKFIKYLDEYEKGLMISLILYLLLFIFTIYYSTFDGIKCVYLGILVSMILNTKNRLIKLRKSQES